jgi:hypothetical protein
MLGELARRAFAGGEVFVLEKGRIPLVAVVSAREWMDYLARRHPGRTITVRRTALSAPRVRPTADKAGGAHTPGPQIRRRPAKNRKTGRPAPTGRREGVAKR